MNKILGYFDLFQNARESQTVTQSGQARGDNLSFLGQGTGGPPLPPPPPWWMQLILFAGIVVGVFFSSAVTQYIAHQTITFSFHWINVVMSVLVAVLITPSAYKNLNINPNQPFFLQFAVFLQTGVFWNVVVEAIAKTVGATPQPGG